jgi:heterotetrameric sarcosine oxidase gamma subunit
LLADSLDISDAAFPYLACAEFGWRGCSARLFRVSFSGERAYELAVPASLGDVTIRAIMAAGEPLGIVPYGTEALGVMRIEKGHVAGNELNGTTTAADLGLGKLMAKRKDYIGRVLASRPGLSAPERPVLVGVKPVDRSQRLHAGAHFLSAGASATLENDEGFVSSVAFSPMLGHYVALGFLANGARRLGERIRAHDPVRGADVEVEVTQPVFYDPQGSRLTNSGPSDLVTPAIAVGDGAPRDDMGGGQGPQAWLDTARGQLLRDNTRGELREDSSAGVRIRLHANLGIARVIARKNARAAVVEGVRRHFQIELPMSPRRVSQRHVAAIGVAPESWLLTQEEDSSHSLLAGLQAVLGSSASVCDQTDAYVVLGLSGLRLLQVLAKLISIDLHPRCFRPGDAVQTLAHQISVILWRVEDVDGLPVFELAVPRSYLASLHEALCQSAAEFGLEDMSGLVAPG